MFIVFSDSGVSDRRCRNDAKVTSCVPEGNPLQMPDNVSES